MPTGRNHNVVALPANKLPAIYIAATAQLGARISGSRNEVWACTAYSEGQPVNLIIKLGLSTRAMMVEVLCAQLASCLGLGASPPYLVTVNPRHVGRANGTPVLTFGVESVSERGHARPIRSLDLLLQTLDSMKVTDLACAFDEWVANDVRSPSDILVGTDSRVYFIDYEAAMGPHLPPNATATNWLADRLLERTSTSERAAFLRKLRSRMAALQRLQMGEVPSAVQFSQDGVAIYTQLLQFLQERLSHLDQIMTQRVLPQQMYLRPEDEAPPASAALGNHAPL